MGAFEALTISSHRLCRWYLTVALAAATGKDSQSDDSYVTRIINNNDSPFEEMASRLEAPLKMLLRPVKNNGAKFVSFVRPHVGDIVKMDANTYDYVSTLEKEEVISQWIGNVTKYNILTGYGRAYIDDLGHTIAFNIDQFENNLLAHGAATASMDERARQQGGGKRKLVGDKATSYYGNQ
jgi:hypothetical protein